MTNFEGNANAVRILTRQYPGKSAGGLRLTCTTIASLLKYPCASNEVDRNYKHRKKYGFFRSDSDAYEQITAATHMVKDTNAAHSFHRHPYVYLTEAADDICYMVIDMEDAHRINILSRDTIESSLLSIITEVTSLAESDKIKNYCRSIKDNNEAVSFLRAMTINVLVNKCAEIYISNLDLIINGKFENTLLDIIEDDCPSIKQVIQLSRDKIYNHPSVIEIEIAGYNVMSELLQMFVPAILQKDRGTYEKKILKLMPSQYQPNENFSSYEKIMLVLDHISAMNGWLCYRIVSQCKRNRN